jgi:hypothetical protein
MSLLPSNEGMAEAA